MSSPRLSSKSNDDDTYDFPADPDMKLARKVITALTSDIVGTIQHEISNILDSARGKSLIGDGLYSKLSEKYSNKDLAREFLEAAVCRFTMERSEFDTFLEIFDNTPSLEIVSKKIRRALAEASGNQDSNPDASTPSFTISGAGGLDSALPRGIPYASQRESSSKKNEVVTWNEMAKQDVTEARESGTSTVQTFSTQTEYYEESEPGKNIEASSIEAEDDTATSVQSIMPSYYDRAQRMIRTEKDEAELYMQKSAHALRHVKEDLQYADFAPKFNSEVQDTGKNYQTYIANVGKKEAELEELKKTYEKGLQKFKAKHKEKLKDRDEQMEQDKDDLKCKYEKDMEKLMDEIKELKKQANIRDSSLQTMTITIEYSNKVAKLKDEISGLKDEISSQKDTISGLMKKVNQSILHDKDRKLDEKDRKLDEKDRKLDEKDRKIDEKDKKIKELEQKLGAVDQHHATDVKDVVSTNKRLMETGEHT